MKHETAKPGFDPTEQASHIKSALDGRALVFVGMMGSGKSAIGRLVATTLGMEFFDSDHEIESAANMEIAEIFEQHGEAYFRAGEERVIKRLLSGGPIVLSLGGGAFLSQKTCKLVKKRAVSIWLTAEIDILLERVMRRPGKRPLLQTDDPKATLGQLMEARHPIYTKADIAVPSSRSSKNITCSNVLSALLNHLEDKNG